MVLQDKWTLHENLKCRLLYTTEKRIRIVWIFCVNIRWSEVGGVFHCYAGSVEMAKEILDWGMYIAFGGSLTFKKSVRPVEVAKYVPLDKIVIETDSPYLTPEPHRGKRNSSLYIHYVAEKLAAVKGISVEEIENATYENAKMLWNKII